MTLSIDPQVGAALQKMVAAMGEVDSAPAPDISSRRRDAEAMFAGMSRLQPIPADVDRRDFTVKSHDGVQVKLRWFQKSGAQPGSAVLYLHGGGMILGSVDMYDAIIKRLVSQSGVPFLAVEYRLAPENPHPTPIEDCYAALLWLFAQAQELRIDPTRIAVMGDSAGGGLAAATALMARDRGGPALAKQILIYPMLDDRNTQPISEMLPFLTWTWEDNSLGWGSLIGEQAGKDGVHHHAAPARATDLSKLPPAYIDVGQLDIFCREDVDYAHRLIQAGVPTELHVHPGVMHGFEAVAPDADVSQRTIADRLRVLRSL